MKDIIIRIEDGIATVVINRPHVLNAMTRDTKKELLSFFHDANEDVNIRAIIVTGSGERAFCTGTDVKDMATYDCEEAEKMLWLEHHMNDAIRYCSKPVIAAVNGHAVGGGCLMAILCDYSIVSNNAVLGFPEINNGVPGSIEIAILHKYVGLARAKKMIYLGETFTPEQAYEWGMINEVVPKVQVYDRAIEITKKFISKSPNALKKQKELVNKWIDTDFRSAVETSIYAFGLSFSTGEPQNAISEFLHSRKNLREEYDVD